MLQDLFLQRHFSTVKWHMVSVRKYELPTSHNLCNCMTNIIIQWIISCFTIWILQEVSFPLVHASLQQHLQQVLTVNYFVWQHSIVHRQTKVKFWPVNWLDSVKIMAHYTNIQNIKFTTEISWIWFLFSQRPSQNPVTTEIWSTTLNVAHALVCKILDWI